jgi:hypothetical protein
MSCGPRGSGTRSSSPLSAGGGVEGAPNPGDRAPDGRVVDGPTGERRRLFDLYRGHHFSLLLFGAGLGEVASEIRAKYGSVVQPFIIKGIMEKVPGWDGPRLIDPDEFVAHSYGASEQKVILVRPDGYVAFRGTPSDVAALEKHLDTFLIANQAQA